MELPAVERAVEAALARPRVVAREARAALAAAVARQYPGGRSGRRSAAEFARWGAQEGAKSLAAAP